MVKKVSPSFVVKSRVVTVVPLSVGAGGVLG